MAIDCTPDALAENALCWNLFPPKVQKAILVRLACAVTNGESVGSCEAEVLADDPFVSCLVNNVPDSALDAILLSLFCAFVASGGLSGGGSILQYDVDPNLEGITPTNQDSPAIAYQKNGAGPTVTWNTTTHVWQ